MVLIHGRSIFAETRCCNLQPIAGTVFAIIQFKEVSDAKRLQILSLKPLHRIFTPLSFEYVCVKAFNKFS